MDAAGKIQKRERFLFLGGKSITEVEQELRHQLKAPSLTLLHDSVAQMQYVRDVYSPQGVFAILAAGTSFAFTMASSKYPDAFDGLTSTFSHMVVGGAGPFCNNCHRNCLGAWYKDLNENHHHATSPAVCAAVSIALRLPISMLFLAGGALADPVVRASVENLEVRLATARVEFVAEPVFSGAIGAALAARSGMRHAAVP